MMMKASRADSLLVELSHIERIAKQQGWTKQEEDNAKSKLIDDFKHDELEEHLENKKPSK